MGFFRATLLERAARYTQTCFATLTVSVFPFSQLDRAFRSQFARFHIALHRPARPLFLSDSFLAFVFGSGLPCSVFAPVSNLAL